ncbi:MAG: FAD-binding oxidoreductase [Pseudomonadota bacterium]
MARPISVLPDVTVMGGGIFGLSCAYEMQARGARVHLVERHAIGAGSSGGPVGAMSPHVPELWNPKKQFQLDSLLMAAAWWQRVETTASLSSGYARLGRLQPLADAEAIAFAQARTATAAQLWGDAARWSVITDPGTGFAPLSPTGTWVHDTLSARIDPRRALTALAAAFRTLGGTITIGDHRPQGETLWTTGTAGLADLSEALGQPLGAGVKGQALTLAFDAPDAPQLLCDGLHVVPHDNGTVAIGSTSELVWDDPATTDAQLDMLHARAVAFCPWLRDAPVIDRWASLRPRARTRAPMLGHWPNRPGHHVANGGFKIGFGMAPKVAEVMAGLILDGKDAIPNGFRVEDSLR